MKKISLSGKWNLYYYDAAEELPKDLYFGMNIKETERFETYDFRYEFEFEAEETDGKAHLLFEGVDCLAEYWLGYNAKDGERGALERREPDL